MTTNQYFSVLFLSSRVISHGSEASSKLRTEIP